MEYFFKRQLSLLYKKDLEKEIEKWADVGTSWTKEVEKTSELERRECFSSIKIVKKCFII